MERPAVAGKRVGTATPSPQERFALLRAKLQDLRYHQPLGLESAPLVEQLLADLLRSNEQLGEQRSHAEVAGQELVIAQTQVHPLRKENGRLLRENNRLHLELITQSEEGAARLKAVEGEKSQLEKSCGDLRFVSSQQAQRVRLLEEELGGLRERFDQALQQNGVVLPSGHEVRWHGRKEHMEAHSPVEAAAMPPAAPGPSSASAGPAAVADAAAAAAAVQASEVQITRLQARLDATTTELGGARRELAEALEKVASREGEIERLGRELEGGRDYGTLSLKHIQESNQQAVAQLNHQVRASDTSPRLRHAPARQTRPRAPDAPRTPLQGGISSVLRAMNVPREFALGTLRLSTGRHTTMGEVERAAELILAEARKQRDAADA